MYVQFLTREGQIVRLGNHLDGINSCFVTRRLLGFLTVVAAQGSWENFGMKTSCALTTE